MFFIQVVDLLNPNNNRPLTVRWSKNRGFYVENLFTIECETVDDLMAVLDEGQFLLSFLAHFIEPTCEYFIITFCLSVTKT